MGKARIGLKKVEFGDVATDGGMGNTLTEFGETVSSTALLANDSPTVTDFFIEEQDDPFYSSSVDGKTTLKWSSYNVEPAALVRIKGGAVSVDANEDSTWEAPDVNPNIEVSTRVTMKDGTIVEIPRGKMDAIFTWNMQKDKLAQVDLTITVLKPIKDGVSKLSIKTIGS
jgi:hypothetical protein